MSYVNERERTERFISVVESLARYSKVCSALDFSCTGNSFTNLMNVDFAAMAHRGRVFHSHQRAFPCLFSSQISCLFWSHRS